LQLETLNNKELIDLISALRPAYKVPHSETMANDLIPALHTSILSKINNNGSQVSGSLLIKIDTFVEFYLQQKSSSIVFMKRSDYGFDFEEMLENVLKEAEEFYGTKIKSICWASTDLSIIVTHKTIPTYKCFLSLCDEIEKNHQNEEIFSAIKSIIREFETQLTEIPSRYLDVLQFFSTNIEKLRKLDVEDTVEISRSTREKLYDRNFYAKVQQNFQKFESIESFRSFIKQEPCSLSEAVNKWFELNCGENFGTGLNCQTKIFAYVLDHRFKGSLLSAKEKHEVGMKLLMILKQPQVQQNEETEYAKFLKYRQSKEEFASEELLSLSSEEFWLTMSEYAPKLSSIALDYALFPAKVISLGPTKSYWDDLSLNADQKEKVLFIYNSLRTK
jgi:hypothetical protein